MLSTQHLMKFCWFYQNDLLQLFQPFGVITKLVMLRAKNQVFFHLFCIMVKTVIYLLTLAKFFVLISFIMSAFCIGSSPNARCSFSHQCSAILHQCAANHQVKIYMYILNICLEPFLRMIMTFIILNMAFGCFELLTAIYGTICLILMQ